MKIMNAAQQGREAAELSSEAKEMGIDQASFTILMDALGKLYSRPVQAALREYLANALDSHAEAGGNRPKIEITLPTAGDNLQKNYYSEYRLLRIRDYGTGIKEEDFHKVLGHYGASTKRDSNEFSGGFGLGAKSGFAISDSFHMTSYQNGNMVKARFFKNEMNKGYTEIVERKEGVDEPDGMLVEIMVPSGNTAELKKYSLDENNLFLAVSPSDLAVQYDNEVEYKWDSVHSDEYVPLTLGEETVGWVSVDDWRLNDVRAVIGSAAYTLRSSKDFGFGSEFGAVLEKLEAIPGAVLHLPIGSVDLPSSREEITYTEKSMKLIMTRAKEFIRLFHEHLRRTLNQQDEGGKAMKYAVKATDWIPYEELTWRGNSLPLRKSVGRYKDEYDVIGTTGRFFLSESGVGVTEKPFANVSSHWLTFFLTKEKVDNNFLIYTMFAGSEEEMESSANVIRSRIRDYRLGLEESGSLDRNGGVNILLLREGEESNVWFQRGEVLNIKDFVEDVRAYRAQRRAEAKIRRAQKSEEPVTSSAQVTKRQNIYRWATLSTIPSTSMNLKSTTKDCIVADGADVYYLTRDAVMKSDYPEFYRNLSFMHNGLKFDNDALKLLYLCRTVLGDNAKVVFLEDRRAATRIEFLEDIPKAVEMPKALAGKLTELWENLKSGKSKENGIPLTSIYRKAYAYHERVRFIAFIKSLTDEEHTNLPDDLLDFYFHFNDDTFSHRLCEQVITELLGKGTVKEIQSWVTDKMLKMRATYPLISHLNCSSQEQWDSVKLTLLNYIAADPSMR